MTGAEKRKRKKWAKLSFAQRTQRVAKHPRFYPKYLATFHQLCKRHLCNWQKNDPLFVVLGIDYRFKTQSGKRCAQNGQVLRAIYDMGSWEVAKQQLQITNVCRFGKNGGTEPLQNNLAFLVTGAILRLSFHFFQKCSASALLKRTTF